MYLTNKFILTTIIALGVSTSASALEIGAGANVGGVSAGAGASVGHGGGASVGAGASIGGSGYGGSDGHSTEASVGTGASIGGSTGTAGVGVGVGHGSGASTGGTQKPGSAIATRTKISGNTAKEVKIAKLEALLGATVTSSDRKMIGMVEGVVAAPNNQIDVTIRLNAALRAQIPTVTLRMKMPKRNPKRIRLDFSENRFLKIVSG